MINNFSKDTIISSVRIKPCQPNEQEDKIAFAQNEKQIMLSKLSEQYQYEMAFEEDKDNEYVFKKLGKQLIDEFLEGKNVCIFAYGQTSSGKTHTMKGNDMQPGFIPLTINYLFEKIKEDTQKQIQVKVSYLELYMENVIDLLNPQPNKSLDIREHPTRGLIVQDITEQLVVESKEAIEFFMTGEEKRKFGGTDLNIHSSRSHVIFRVNIDIRNPQKPDKQLFSTLNLIDLAGSENIQKANTEGYRKLEGVNINKSLLSLSNVIQKLSSNPNSYINFRDSKLTRLLQPCLGGNSRTAVICTISGLKQNLAETRETLKFGINAGGIKNDVKVNEKLIVSTENDNLSRGILNEQIKENTELKTKIQTQEIQLIQQDQMIQKFLQEKCISDGQLNEKLKEIVNLNVQIDELKGKMNYYKIQEDQQIKEKQELVSYIQSLQKQIEDLQKQNQQLGIQNKQKQDQNLEKDKYFQEYQSQQQQIANLIKEKQVTYEKLEKEMKKNDSLNEQIISLKSQLENQKQQFQAKSNSKSPQNQSRFLSFYKENINPNNDQQNLGIQLVGSDQGERELLNNQGNSINKQISEVKNSVNQLEEQNSLMKNKNNILKTPIQTNHNFSFSFDNINQEDNLNQLETEGIKISLLITRNGEIRNLNYQINQLNQEIIKKDEEIFNLKNKIQELQTIGSNQNLQDSLYSDEALGFRPSFNKRGRDMANISKKINNEQDTKELQNEVKYLNRKIKNQEQFIQEQRKKIDYYIENNDKHTFRRNVYENVMINNGLLEQLK